MFSIKNRRRHGSIFPRPMLSPLSSRLAVSQMNGIKIHFFNNKNFSCGARKFWSAVASLDHSFVEPTIYPINLDPFPGIPNPADFRNLKLAEAGKAHAFFLKTCLLYSNVHAVDSFIDTYSNNGCLDYAFNLFGELSEPCTGTSNLMIAGCNRNANFEHSWRVFRQMHILGVGFDEFTWVNVVAACGSLESVVRGEQVYACVFKNGFFSNDYVRSGMIDLLCMSSRVKDALKVLHDVDCENVVCWNAVVSGAVKNSDNQLALEVFMQIHHHGRMIPNSFTFSSVLAASAALKEIHFGKCIHGWTTKCGAGTDIFVGTAILDLYAKCGDMCDAVRQFDLMPTRNVVTWTALISGFVRKDDSAAAVSLLMRMLKMGEDLNSYTISSVLTACGNPAMFKEAIQIHGRIFKMGFYSNSVVKASLISMYAKVGAIDSSETVFSDSHDLKHVGIWANMISAFVQHGSYEKAVALFQRMLKEGIKPDKFSSSSVLSLINDLALGRQMHGYILKAGLVTDVSVGSSIVTMYSKCGNLEESLKFFLQLDSRDIVSYTSMLAGYAEHGCAERAIQLFREMRFEEFDPDERILIAALAVCSDLCSLKLGKEIHGFSLRLESHEHIIDIDGALVNMYSKCGDLDSAKIVFHNMRFKDNVSWSSLVSGFAQNGLIQEAFSFFQDMLLSGLSVDIFTMSSLIWGVSDSNTPRTGNQLHVHAVKMGLESEASVGTSLAMMYSKFGIIRDSLTAFQRIKDPDLFSFTAMIASYAQHGKGLEALQVYEVMKKSGIEPDPVTFVGVLSACSRSGLVDEAYFHLNSMIEDYGFEPGHKHYACMVDLLCRAGRLIEAERFIANMPIEPQSLVWETLLSACNVHGYHNLSKKAAEKIMKMQPSGSGAYVSLSNICADAGSWEHVLKIRQSMQETGIKKEYGWSSV